MESDNYQTTEERRPSLVSLEAIEDILGGKSQQAYY